MSLWRVTQFSDGPHPDVAIVRLQDDLADDPADVLADYLAARTDADGYIDVDTVWALKPRDQWKIAGPLDGPVISVIGAGCRC